jgi:hypothetical protein
MKSKLKFFYFISLEMTFTIIEYKPVLVESKIEKIQVKY